MLSLAKILWQSRKTKSDEDMITKVMEASGMNHSMTITCASTLGKLSADSI